MAIESSLSTSTRLGRDQVLEDVRRIVGEYAEIAPETIGEENALEADLGCDSLDIVEISMEVEEHFGISVPDDVAEQGRTVGGIVDGVLQLLGEVPGK